MIKFIKQALSRRLERLFVCVIAGSAVIIAVTGAGTGALKGEDPGLGAVGAALGELGGMAYKKIASENLAPGEAVNKETGVNVAKFVAGTAAVLVTGGQKDVSIAIDTGGRAAEFNALEDQGVMKGRDTLKRKFAQKLVEEGFISQEELDANFYDLTAGDLVDIYTGNKRIFRVEGPTEVAQRSHEAKATLIAELQRMDAAKLSYAAGEVDPKIYARMLAAESLEGIGRGFQYISDESNAIRSRNDHLWIDPRLEGSFLDITRTNSHDYKDYINDYASVLFGNYEHPSSHRNLVKGSAYVQTLKDEISILFGLAKWGCQSIGEMDGYSRSYGNKKAAANGGDLGRAVPDVVIIVTGAVGAAKGAAAAGKGMVNLAKAAGGATKDAAKAASRATGVLKEAPTVARASGEKAVAKDMSPRVKPQYSGGAYGKLDRVPGLERHHMPADSITDISRTRGPSIQMDAADHALTSSYGNSLRAQEYRQKMKTMLDNDNMRDVMAMEIRDVKNYTGTKYNSALFEMLEYAKESGQLLPKPPLK